MTEQNTSAPGGTVVPGEPGDAFVQPENEDEAAAWKRVEAALDAIAKEEHLTPVKDSGPPQAQPRKNGV